MSTRSASLSCLAPLLLAMACAGRNPVPTATVQPHDSTSNCTMVSAELAANQRRIGELDSENTGTVVGNVALAVVGVALFPPLLFAMDLKNAAATERDSLTQRNTFLTSLQLERCPSGVAAAPVAVASPSTPAPVASTPIAAAPSAPASEAAPVATVAPSAAVAAIRPNVPTRQTLEDYVRAARAECQRRRNRNCDSAVEAAAAEYESAWQAQSASRTRAR